MYSCLFYFLGRKRKRETEDNEESNRIQTPSSISKLQKRVPLWPVFDSGGFGMNMDSFESFASIIRFQTLKINYDRKESNMLFLSRLSVEEFIRCLIVNLGIEKNQYKLNNIIFVDHILFKVLGSVTKQIKLINNFLQKTLSRYNYPKVSRTNVLSAPTVLGHYICVHTKSSCLVSPVKFTPVPKIRQLPCYGNLELSNKIKQERISNSRNIMNNNCARNGSRKRRYETCHNTSRDGLVKKELKSTNITDIVHKPRV